MLQKNKFFWVPKEPFSNQFNHYKKKCNGKVVWMLKVTHRTISGNKKPVHTHFYNFAHALYIFTFYVMY